MRLVALLLLAACARDVPAVDAGLPEGALVSAAPAAAEILARCAGAFEGSPVAAAAESVRAEPGCARLTAHAASVSELTPGCDADPLEGLGGDIAFALPVGERRWVGTAMVTADGSVAVDARANLEDVTGLARLGVPDAEPPGPTRLSDVDALAHARFRVAGGIDLASLVPEQSQADEMFKLKSSLFAGAVLDGTWEVAMYLPPAGRAVPRMALGVGTRSQDAAKAAMEQYLGQVTTQWHLQTTPFDVDGLQGSCLADLHLLPGLAPCYVSTPDLLVVGWDPESVAQAVRRRPEEPDPLGGGSGWLVHLERLPQADRLVAAAVGGPPVDTAYPWGTLTGVASQGEDGVTRVQMRTSTGCGR